MTVTDGLLVAIGLGFGFLLRLPLALLPATDQYVHDLFIAWQKGRRWVYQDFPDSVYPGSWGYPVLVHWLIARFPRSWWRPVALVVNIVPDLVWAAGVYIAVDWLLADVAGLPADARREFAFLAMLLLVSLPVLLPITARVKATGGRTVGGLMTTVAFVALAVFMARGGWVWLPVALVGMLGTFLTSRFGLQTTVFFSVLMALAYLNPAPVLVLVTALAISWFVRPLRLREVLIGKINHLIWYFRDPKIGNVAHRRNLLLNVIRLPWYVVTDWKRAGGVVLLDAPLLIAAYSLPPLWLLGYALATPGVPTGLWAAPALRFCLVMVGAGAVVFVITSIRPMTVMGQAERYFEYAAPMLVVAAVVASAQYELARPMHLVALVVVQVCVVVLIHVLSHPERVSGLLRPGSDAPQARRLAEFLTAQPDEARVAVLPIKQAFLLAWYTYDRADARVRYYYPTLQREGQGLTGLPDFQEDTEFFDLFAGRPERLAEKYGINYVVTERSFEDAVDSEFTRALHERRPLYTNARYRVYRITEDTDPDR